MDSVRRRGVVGTPTLARGVIARVHRCGIIPTMKERPKSVRIPAQLKSLVKKVVAESEWLHHPPPGRVNNGWPVFDEKEVLNALEALLNVRISQGPKVRLFEEMAARYVGTRYAIACNSGSSANLLALTALIASGKVERGSEVIIPATTFATVASPILQVGLVPVYVDISDRSWNIDPSEIEKAIGPKTRVIMPVHTFGNPADMPAIMKIARKHNLLVLEDCCEAHGAMIGKKKVGSFSDLSTLSFFVAHNITTGEGGMIFTNDKELDVLLRSLREFGRVSDQVMAQERFTYGKGILKGFDARYIFERLGYNVRMTDITASMGVEQIKKLDGLNRKRFRIVDAYLKALKPYEKYLVLPTVEKGHVHTFYGFPFVIRKDAPFTRMEFISFLEKRGIETRPFFGGCLPDQPGFRDEPKRIVGDLPVARWIRDYSVFVGCHAALTPLHVKHVTSAFKDFFSAL
jgi:CDP-4-dehydro-6-deoxyglucose reductase, E1